MNMSATSPYEPDRLADLVARHPRLFRGKMPERSHLAPGWLALADTLCAEIEALVGPEMELPLRVAQVKEKYGALRLYVHATVPGTSADSLRDRAQALADAVRTRSEGLCEGCGVASSLQKLGPWWTTLCPACQARKEAAARARGLR